MIEYIKDDHGKVVGEIKRSGNLITYSCYGFGVIGDYDTHKRQYHRWKCAPGQQVFPMNNIDYGIADVMYWASKR